ncbi:MAG: rod shape-determining protein RodA [Candidatus Eremiobacteraeota bacterium]|nr:rod shape-determining protein RodA [Candidatus Eremiobacteraeota bacterium]
MATLTFVSRRRIRELNWPLLVGSIAATAIGLFVIQSAGLHTAEAHTAYRKQAVYAVLGIGIMFGCSVVDYRIWRRIAPYLYGLNLAALLAILVLPHTSHGAQRWIAIGPLIVQPSEPAKLFLAIAIAAMLCRSDYRKLTDMWLPLLATAVPAILILKQPDLGTTLVIMAILTAELYFGLRRIEDFLIYIGGLAAAATYVVSSHFLKPFQKARLLVFLNPKIDPQGVGYSLNQSKIAVGNGQWIGRGWHQGTQTQLNFVPEHATDFAFTVLAEEFGFLGVVVLLALYVTILVGGVQAMLAARDRFSFLLATGIVAMLCFHMIVNIGMTIGIMPITGIPLPFISYGGSAIVTDFAAIGILLNIYAQKDRLIARSEE